MYRFTPPTVPYRVGTTGLWRRVVNQRGVAVVIYDTGRITTATEAPCADDDGIAAVYPGGRTYEIDDATAAQLTDAGYSACLEEVV